MTGNNKPNGEAKNTLLWINGEFKEGPRNAPANEFNGVAGATDRGVKGAIQTIPTVFDDNGKRGMDLYSSLLDKKLIMVWGQVDENMAQDFIARLRHLEMKYQGSDEEIEVMINSPGGSVIDGYAMFNAMMQSPLKIRTTVYGMAASMGAFLLNAGDKRGALPESRIMIHQVSAGTQGKGTDMDESLTETLKIKTRLTQLMTARAQEANPDLTFKRMWDLMERDTWLNAEKAKELGLVDEVVMPETSPDHAPHRKWLKNYPEIADVVFEDTEAVDELRQRPERVTDPSVFDRKVANDDKKDGGKQARKKTPGMKP